VRGSMWGMYFENPTGSVVFGKELAVLDDPDAVAYVYGEDADEEKGEKNKNDENDSRARRGRRRASPWTNTIPRTSPCARTTGKTRGGTVPAWPARSSSGYPRGRPPQICPRRARRWPVKAWTRRGPAPSDRPGHSGPSPGATTHRPTTVAGGGRRAGRLCLIAHTHSPRSASLTRKLICQTRGKTLGRGEAGRRVSGRRRCGGTATRTRTRKPRDSGRVGHTSGGETHPAPRIDFTKWRESLEKLD
jgi:hypothetical protein